MNMHVPAGHAWALVPVKRLCEAKSRLAPCLSPNGRQSLQRAMLAHVVGELLRVRTLAGVGVVTGDPEVARLAHALGARTLREPTPGGLNPALQAGSTALAATGAELIAIVPADLPDLEAADIACALDTVRHLGAPLVIPDSLGSGTNGLVFRATDTPAFAFGEGSFARHMKLPGARAFPLPSLARDVDRPADLAAFRARERVLDEETTR